MTTQADLARTLEAVKSTAIRLGIRDAGSWFVGTRGGSYLYLCATDDTTIGRQVLQLGPTKSKAQERLWALMEDLHIAEDRS